VNFGYKNTKSGIELFVEDSGCGIDDSNQELIFKPFFKGKNLVAGSKGFGLGLAISKGLTRLLGSDLLYTSTIKKGTRFYFEFDKNDIDDGTNPMHNQNDLDVKMKSIFFYSLDNKHMQN
jgi:signal transduction histidine kinase